MKIRRPYKIEAIMIMMLFVTFSICWFTKEQKRVGQFELTFLPSYGDINIQSGQDSPITFYYVVKNSESITYQDFENALVTVDSIESNEETMSISNVSVSELLSTTSKGIKYALYGMNFTISKNNNFSATESFHMSTLSIDGTSYAIGDLDFHVFEQLDSEEGLHLKRRMAMSMSENLEPFHAIFQNQSVGDIMITKVNMGKFANAKVAWDINDETQRFDGIPFSFSGGSEHRMEVLLDSCVQEGISLYYVSPVVEYKTDTHIVILPFTIMFLEYRRTQPAFLIVTNEALR